MRKTLFTLAALALASTGAFAKSIPAQIAFDGYCDGMALTASGAHVTGNSIGCVTDPVFGYNVKVTSAGKGYVVDATYSTGLIWFISVAHTFEIYDSTGALVNTGTWSAGAPSNARQGLKAAAAR